MRFIVGLLTGLVLGAAGAVAYSIQTGRDLREAVEDVRADLNDRDFEALGARLEARFSQMQAQIEEKIAQAREKAAPAIDDAADSASETVDQAADAAADAVEGMGSDPKPAG